MTARDPYVDVDGADDEEEGLGLDGLKDIAGFVLRAPRRRPFLATGIFVVVAALGTTVAVVMPRVYNSQVKLLAERDLVGPYVIDPGRSVPRDADNLTRNVADVILRRENMVALVKESNLLARWHATRPTALRWKDALMALWSGAPTESEEVRGLAQTLEKRTVVQSDESTVTISVDWSDPRTAYDLVSLIQKNFVGAKYDSDVAAVQRAVSTLEDSAKEESKQVDEALAAYKAAQPEPANTTTAGAPAGPPTTPSGSTPEPVQRPAITQAPAAPPAPDPEIAKELDDKRREIRSYEETHQRQLDALNQQLLQAQLTLTPMHPTVIALEEQIKTLKQPSPELARLKAEEASLMAQIAPIGSPQPGAPGPAYWSPPPQATRASTPTTAYEETPAVALAHSKLETAVRRYQEVMVTLDRARLELDNARSDTQKFSVVTPAEVARSPKKPLAALIASGSVLAAAFLALFGAAAADWHAGRILEAWQIRRRLKIDVLGDLELPL